MNKLTAFTVLYNIVKEVYCDWEIEIGDCTMCKHNWKGEADEPCLGWDCVEALSRSIGKKLEERGLMLTLRGEEGGGNE